MGVHPLGNPFTIQIHIEADSSLNLPQFPHNIAENRLLLFPSRLDPGDNIHEMTFEGGSLPVDRLGLHPMSREVLLRVCNRVYIAAMYERSAQIGNRALHIHHLLDRSQAILHPAEVEL